MTESHGLKSYGHNWSYDFITQTGNICITSEKGGIKKYKTENEKQIQTTCMKSTNKHIPGNGLGFQIFEL
mgnify:CR=1 FL=1